MKFSDLFLPKIARSDPNARIEAVNACKDTALLKRVIENDKDDQVVQIARQRLETLSTT